MRTLSKATLSTLDYLSKSAYGVSPTELLKEKKAIEKEKKAIEKKNEATFKRTIVSLYSKSKFSITQISETMGLSEEIVRGVLVSKKLIKEE